MKIILFDWVKDKEMKKFFTLKLEKEDFSFNPTQVFGLGKIHKIFKNWKDILEIHIVIKRLNDKDKTVTTEK